MAKVRTTNMLDEVKRGIRSGHRSPLRRNSLLMFSGTRRPEHTRNPTEQRRVADLSRPYGGSSDYDLEQDGFVGMWRDRQDLEDSSAWVRGVREREWVKQSG